MYQYSILPGRETTEAAERQRKLGKVYRLLIGLARKRGAEVQPKADAGSEKQNEQVQPA